LQSLNLINLYINLPWSCELRRTRLLVKKSSVFSWFSIKTIFGWIFLFLNFHHFSSGNGDADADAGVVRLSCFVNNCGGNGDAGVVRLSCFVDNPSKKLISVFLRNNSEIIFRNNSEIIFRNYSEYLFRKISNLWAFSWGKI